MDLHSSIAAKAALSTAINHYDHDLLAELRLDFERKSMEAEDLRAHVFVDNPENGSFVTENGSFVTWKQDAEHLGRALHSALEFLDQPMTD